jgi:hypothetical protein
MRRTSRRNQPATCFCGSAQVVESTDETVRPDGVVVTQLRKRCGNGHLLSSRAIAFSDGHVDRTNFIAIDGTASYAEPEGASRPGDFD